MIDNSPDFDFPVSTNGSSTSASASPAQRTLLLAPPSLASHESALRDVLSTHDRATTDLHMLDRLSAGLVHLPSATYTLVLVLTDADGSRVESASLLDRKAFALIVESLVRGGKLQSHDGASLAQDGDGSVAREAVLAGLVADGSAFSKPDYDEEEVVSLKFGKGRKGNGAVALNGAVKTTILNPVPAPSKPPAGVGFVDFSDDFDVDDDELIDEDTLLTDEDLKTPVTIRMSTIPYRYRNP
jgi:anamorsin